jgi:hypothetical protein
MAWAGERDGVSRRSVLTGAGTLAAIAGLVPGTISEAAALAVHDGRLAAARAFAAVAHDRGIRTIDLAAHGGAIWQVGRRDLAVPGAVIGMTGWSDWIILRALMEEQGKRVTRERQHAPGIIGWTMA